MKLPNVWGEDALFAYSGMEGRTDWKHPFVATGLSSPGSFVFHVQPERELILSAAKIKMSGEEIVVSDLVLLDRNLFGLIFLNKDTLIGFSPGVPEVRCRGKVIRQEKQNSLVHSTAGGHTALVWKRTASGIKFAFSFNADSPVRARRKAEKGLAADIEVEKAKKIDFFRRLPRPAFSSELQERVYYKACSVLKVNTHSRQGKIHYAWTTPDRYPHKDMWLWDSAFHSLGIQYVSRSLAEDSIKAVLQFQARDGFIAHQMNPEMGRASRITQPPVLAWTSYELYRRTGNKDFLRYVYPRVKKFIAWLYRNRDDDRSGLLEWKLSEEPICRCGESGMDNSPRFDGRCEHMKAVDFNCFAVSEMEFLEKMAQELGLVGDASCWQRERVGKAALINRSLWDDRSGFYFDRQADGAFKKVKTVASFLPLFAGIADKRQAASLIDHLKNPKEFWTGFPVPSVSRDESVFCRDMWRGPTWVNYNFLVIEGLKRYGYGKLAGAIAGKTIKEIGRWYRKTGVISEFYDSEAKLAPGQLQRKEWLGHKRSWSSMKDYHWSAALYVAMVQNKAGYL
ncbi:MAG: trehalase family glycosidase [Candidatus Omnitrophota bacterium]